MKFFLRTGFICFCSMLISGNTLAQYTSDTLFFRDGTYTVGEILDFDYDVVVFKTPDKQVYMARKSAMNKMYNSRQNVYSRYKIPGAPNQKAMIPYPRNEMGITILDLLRTDIRMYYEYRPIKTRFALRVPLTFGFNSGNFNTVYSLIGINTVQNINFAIGLEPRLYSGKLSRNSYVFGVSAEYMYVNRTQFYGGDPWWRGHALRFMILNGSTHLVAGRVQLGTEIAIGLAVPVADPFYSQGMTLPTPVPQFKVRFNIGYRW